MNPLHSPVSSLSKRLGFTFASTTLAALTVVAGLSAPVAAAPVADTGDTAIALNLANLLRSARTVIANNQKLINDPTVGDKGLTGKRVLENAKKIFRTRTGHDIPVTSGNSLQTRLLKAQMASIVEVVDDNQRTINRVGIGFKGFVPAVFGRLVNERFKAKIGEYAEIKVTAPMSLVRNRKARPDRWERKNIQDNLQAKHWPKGKIFTEFATNSGRQAFRVLVPEYYGAGCLSCHGGPKGEIDVTGYPKEGGEEGWLGGAISITFFRQ